MNYPLKHSEEPNTWEELLDKRAHYVRMPAVQQGIDKLVWINKLNTVG